MDNKSEIKDITIIICKHSIDRILQRELIPKHELVQFFMKKIDQQTITIYEDINRDRYFLFIRESDVNGTASLILFPKEDDTLISPTGYWISHSQRTSDKRPIKVFVKELILPKEYMSKLDRKVELLKIERSKQINKIKTHKKIIGKIKLEIEETDDKINELIAKRMNKKREE
ncbi:hypothetical protein KAU43_03585 [candidate division WOR-3 bacterium]|nr:hypothetical protein [candidate division WOR-3 bacterium]